MELKSGFSVLMSVYQKDNPSWFEEALKSVYTNQTVKPSEIVIVKDGPVYNQIESILKKYSKIYPLKIIQLEKNMGLHIALNEGLKHCSYELVARMDADDISLPHRFELQLKAFEKYPGVVVIGGVKFHTKLDKTV